MARGGGGRVRSARTAGCFARRPGSRDKAARERSQDAGEDGEVHSVRQSGETFNICSLPSVATRTLVIASTQIRFFAESSFLR